MKLIYRAQIFTYQPRSAHPYRQPTALNWRYQIQGETYSNTYSRSLDRSPHAVNWCYQALT
jgi:hypothetical protein